MLTRMLPTTPLRCLLSDFDAAAGDLRREGAAEVDVDGLGILARTLAADICRWRDLIDRLGGAAVARLDSRRATAIVAETVFDEVLSPAAWRLLSAHLALGDVLAP